MQYILGQTAIYFFSTSCSFGFLSDILSSTEGHCSRQQTGQVLQRLGKTDLEERLVFVPANIRGAPDVWSSGEERQWLHGGVQVGTDDVRSVDGSIETE